MYSDIDKIFKDGLTDYSQRPPVFVWDTIEQSLRKKREARRKSIVYSIAASIALLLAFGAGYLFTGIELGSNEIVQTTVPPVKNETNEQKIDNVENPINNNLNGTVDTESQQTKKVAKEQTNINTEPVKEKGSDSMNGAIDEPKQSNIKKVSSMGTLMPPGYGSNATYSSNSDIAVHENSFSAKRENDIEKIYPKEIGTAEERSIIYVYREIPLNADYEDGKKANTGNLWAVGVSATPLFSYRAIGTSSSDMNYSDDINGGGANDYSNEKPLTSYSAGMDVNYAVATRWNIQAGVYFSEIGQVSENSTVYSSNYLNDGQSYYVNTSSGVVKIEGTKPDLTSNIYQGIESNDALVSFPGTVENYKNATIENDLVQSYSYCEFPVIVNYKFVDRRLDMKVSGGMSANYMYDYNAYLQNDESRYSLDAENNNIKSMSYNGILGFGMEYPIIKNLNVNLNPLFRYSLSSFTNKNSVHPYSLGIYTGLIYIF